MKYRELFPYRYIVHFSLLNIRILLFHMKIEQSDKKKTMVHGVITKLTNKVRLNGDLDIENNYTGNPVLNRITYFISEYLQFVESS